MFDGELERPASGVPIVYDGQIRRLLCCVLKAMPSGAAAIAGRTRAELPLLLL